MFFTDLSEYKIRPVCIFRIYDNQDYMYLPISSNLEKNGIIIDNKSFISGKIDKKSVIIIPKIGIIHKSLILKEIGELKLKYLVKIGKKLCNDLGCEYL